MVTHVGREARRAVCGCAVGGRRRGRGGNWELRLCADGGRGAPGSRDLERAEKVCNGKNGNVGPMRCLMAGRC